MWYRLFGAVLRGIAINRNDVDFVLEVLNFNVDLLMSQLPHWYVDRFEVVKRGYNIFFISKPHVPTGEVVCLLGYSFLCIVCMISTTSLSSSRLI